MPSGRSFHEQHNMPLIPCLPLLSVSLNPQAPPSAIRTLDSPPSFQQARYVAGTIYSRSRTPTFAASSQSTDHTVRTGAWSSGFGRRAHGGGFQQPKCRGFDSQAAKQNFPQESQEDFRNRNPPPLDRRGGLGGELFVLDFESLFFHDSIHT